jgi:hypothetical protein
VVLLLPLLRVELRELGAFWLVANAEVILLRARSTRKGSETCLLRKKVGIVVLKREVFRDQPYVLEVRGAGRDEPTLDRRCAT